MRSFALASIVLLAGGCNDAPRPAPTVPSNADVNRTTATGANATAAPDNTAVNARDRGGNKKTPIDQNENQADIDITANIRKQVVDAKMSTNAENVKIITQDGKVTLRGPVKSADEKKRIEDIAHAVAGAEKVDSQLEVAP